MFEQIRLLAGIRHNADQGPDKQRTVKSVKFPALIPHHQAHGLPGCDVNSGRRESKIVNDDLHLLIFGRTGPETEQQEGQQGFDHSHTSCYIRRP